MGAVKWEMFADLFVHLERWLSRRTASSGSLAG
jgi:hypothetical protein